MRMETPYVVTVPESLGGPGNSAVATSFGIFQGIRACLKEVFGNPLPQGRTVAVQGIGAVGDELVKYLLNAGAVVTIADIDQQKVDTLASEYKVNVVPPEKIHTLDVDVYSPCAMGSVLNEHTIPELGCKIVCGSANNQLATEQDGDRLAQRGILYAPDYIVSAGGVISGLDSLQPGGFNRQRAMDTVSHIYRTMGNVIAISKEQGIPTYRAADVLAEQRIATVRQVKSLAT